MCKIFFFYYNYFCFFDRVAGSLFSRSMTSGIVVQFIALSFAGVFAILEKKILFL